MQVSTLIYAMRPEAEDILASFGQSDDESKDNDDFMNKFDGYFVQLKNHIFERAKFNQRVQAETQTVDQFVTGLYALVEHCQYQGLKEQKIGDRLVVGLHHSKLSERLQLDSDMDLKKALSHGTQQWSWTIATNNCARINEHSSHLRFGKPSQNGSIG